MQTGSALGKAIHQLLKVVKDKVIGILTSHLGLHRLETDTCLHKKQGGVAKKSISSDS